MALLSFIREFIAATRVYANYFTKFRIASGYFERLLETWHFPDERAINKDKTAVTSIKTIDVKPFDFAYDNKTIISIPKTMAFYKGSKYAIVGETGSGKSTFVSLLLKLLPVEANKVFFNQQDSQEINTESLYEKTGFLLQDDYFFDMTILENILLGENNLESKLIRLIKNFQLEDFFLNLEKGLQTKIVNNGANLSGGQKRIISLLRALVREPDILIFDEITNGMDIKLKEKFFCFINKTVSEKILLFITHDQAYLSWFDKVVFINKSKVYLDTHQSLLETNNDYKKMLKNHSI
jgi:ABC-type multidrug transport system fused ATPase/permease subunit